MIVSYFIRYVFPVVGNSYACLILVESLFSPVSIPSATIEDAQEHTFGINIVYTLSGIYGILLHTITIVC